MKVAAAPRPVFLDALWRIQAERALSNTDLARRLGVHPSLISRLRGGEYGVTLRTIDAAVSAFPELGPMLLADLPTGTSRVNNGTPAEEALTHDATDEDR